MSSDFEDALSLYSAGEYGRAFSKILEAARRGDTDAMGYVGSMYTAGEGVQCDYDKALEWEMKSWEGGNKDAAINIAITYRLKGEIVEYKTWLELAHGNGDEEAGLLLAKLYLVSEKERNRARELLVKAIASKRMCEESIEEAHSLLVKIDG